MSLFPIHCGSDTLSSVVPEIDQAISEAGKKISLPYGDDEYTKNCRELIRKVFQNDKLEVCPIISGTASNSLAISTMCDPFGGLICHENSHINKDECGAPEFFSNGAKLITIDTPNGKLNHNEIEKKFNKFKSSSSFKHKIQGVSITQLAENGTTYSLNELKRIGEFCKKNNLLFHMDGARFANALVYLNKTPSEISWKIGLDCLSLGASKNGALAAEVIIFFNSSLINNLNYKQKKTGHVLPRMKFISCQLNAWFKNNLWLKLAHHANEMAKKLRSNLEKINNFKFLFPTHGNEIFVETSKSFFHQINERKVFPKLWYVKKDGRVVLRFVTSHDTTDAVIYEIVHRLKK